MPLFFGHINTKSLQAKKEKIHCSYTQPEYYHNERAASPLPKQGLRSFSKKSTSYCYRHTSSPILIKYNLKHYKSNNIETKKEIHPKSKKKMNCKQVLHISFRL